MPNKVNRSIHWIRKIIEDIPCSLKSAFVNCISQKQVLFSSLQFERDHPKRGSCCYAMNINRDKFLWRRRGTEGNAGWSGEASRAFFLKITFVRAIRRSPRIYGKVVSPR